MYGVPWSSSKIYLKLSQGADMGAQEKSQSSSNSMQEAAFSLQAERSLNSSASTIEINEQVFVDVFGKEHNGRVRGLGLGPTPKSYFGSTSYDVGARWKSLSQSHDLESLKVQLKDITSKYDDLAARHEEVCSKYEDLATRHEEVCGKYEDLAARHEIVSNKLTTVDAFLSQQFPRQWIPNNQDTADQVCDASIRGKMASSHDPYFS